jgi:ribosomal-protein-alanine N-acetyltransferase
VRVATEADFPAIARIQRHCPEAAQWPVGDYSGFRVLLASVAAGEDGIPAGFCAWRQTAPNEAELLNLAVDPAQRRKGVAASLLLALTEQTSGDVFLEVAENNLPAIALYDSLGWEQIGLRPGYYQNGTVHAVVMKKGSC